jgi:hypothetical protein
MKAQLALSPGSFGSKIVYLQTDSSFCEAPKVAQANGSNSVTEKYLKPSSKAN